MQRRPPSYWFALVTYALAASCEDASPPLPPRDAAALVEAASDSSAAISDGSSPEEALEGATVATDGGGAITDAYGP
jgi:hypothetical protein